MEIKSLVMLFVASATLSVFAKQSEIRPGALWYDTAGHVINAHGGGVMYDRGIYWWYGEHKVYGRRGNSAYVGVHAYSSTDLMNWDDRGIALSVVDVPVQGAQTNEADLVAGCIVERPKVICCPKTGRYVMFFHLELRGQGYRAARVGIAVADRPEGPFAFQRSLRPNGAMSRDMTLFVDDDGRAYHVFASEENRTTHIDALTDDCLGYTGTSWSMASGESTEAQCVVKQGGYYYLIGSGCTGWRPNKARLYRAEKLEGPWTNLGNPCRGVNPATGLGPDITWGAQSTYLLPVAGRPGDVIALFDIWHPDNHAESRYVWLPVVFGKDSLFIPWRSAWTPRVAALPKALPLRFMTFNIWGDYFGNPVPEREGGVWKTIDRHAPDLVSLQEVTDTWRKSALFAHAAAKGYATIWGDEDMAFYRAWSENGLKDGKILKQRDWLNHEPLLYNTKRLTLLESGVEFFNLTLTVNKSVTWGVFEERGSGRRFIAFATHLWWKHTKDESDALRVANVEKVVAVVNRAKAKWGDLPVIGGGDLNMVDGEKGLVVFEKCGYADAVKTADVRDTRPSEHCNPVRGTDGKYHGVPGQSGVKGNCMLDHVFYTPESIRATRHAVIVDAEALDVSDHSPVVVDFVLLP